MESETKINAPMEVARAPRVRWRRIMRGILKYSFLILLAIIICLTIVEWVRSGYFDKVDRCEVELPGKNCLLFESRKSSIQIVGFNSKRKTGAFQVRFGSYPIRIELADREFPTIYPASRLGAGWVTQPIFVFDDTYLNPPMNGFLAPQASAATVGHGIIVPHGILLLILGSILMFALMGRRFTLRALLIWITIVCVILGIAVRTSSDSSQDQDRSVQHGA